MPLIKCSVCNAEIAKTAESCPKCGAKNSYVNPNIGRFISEANSGRFRTVVQYEYAGDIVAGRIAKESSKIVWAMWMFGLGIQLPALILSTFFNAFSISQPLIGIGVVVCSIALMITLYKSFFQGEKIFRVEYLDDKVQWQSNDDLAFDEYKRYFLGIN
jgi:hypothetical protein